MEGPREKIQEKVGAPNFNVLKDRVHLRAMSPSDIDQIMVIERASFTSPWSARFFLEEIRVSYSKSILAEIDGRVIAYIVYWQLPTDVDIHNLAVNPDFRRRGIGQGLLTATIDHARERQLNRVTLEVRQSNRIAQRLYESLGFQPKGLRRGYYSNDGEDAIIMVLELASNKG